MRRTKIIATLGPKTSTLEAIEKLAAHGMDIARLNFSHGTHESHLQAISAIKTINNKGTYNVATLLDTKGPEVRTGDLSDTLSVSKDEELIITVDKEFHKEDGKWIWVNFDGFVHDVSEGDTILIDGGILSFKVKKKKGKELYCHCVDGGVLTSRRHVNIIGKSVSLPSITDQDWKDIEFGISHGIDFIALSFVKDPMAIVELKEYLKEKKAHVDVIAKIESAKAIPSLDEIIKVCDGIMVARGDLGAELPLEEVPILQEEMIEKCHHAGKPVIVATHLLESMIQNPTPTRAEVADIATAVMQKTDAIMLSGETAAGLYPYKALSVMDIVARRMERKLVSDKHIHIDETNNPRIEIARSAAIMANNLSAKAIIVFTRRGYTAVVMSNCRPSSLVFAFTNMTNVRRRLNLYWGVTPFRIQFSEDPDKTVRTAIEYLKKRSFVKAEDTIIVVSDVLAGSEHVDTIQVRKIS